MAIEGFDYKEFAQMMSSQAGELVPANFDEMQKNYVVKTLTNFTMLAGEAISNDESLNFNADQAVFVTQIIAEWSFHKSIDLVHSGIMPEHWDRVMQKIAFTIFEIAKQAIQKNIPQDKTLQLIEHHVDKTYKEAIEDLEKRGIISSEISQKAASQSNIDDMARQVQEQEEELARQQAELDAEKIKNIQQIQAQSQAAQAQSQEEPQQEQTTYTPKITGEKDNKLKAIAMVLKLIDKKRVEEVLATLPSDEAEEIRKYIKTPRLEEKISISTALSCLEDLKVVMPKKKKLSQDNIVRGMNNLFNMYNLEDVEQTVKSERPYIKRFVSKAYDGDYYQGIPLKVAKIISGYIKDSIQNEENKENDDNA